MATFSDVADLVRERAQQREAILVELYRAHIRDGRAAVPYGELAAALAADECRVVVPLLHRLRAEKLVELAEDTREAALWAAGVAEVERHAWTRDALVERVADALWTQLPVVFNPWAASEAWCVAKAYSGKALAECAAPDVLAAEVRTVAARVVQMVEEGEA